MNLRLLLPSYGARAQRTCSIRMFFIDCARAERPPESASVASQGYRRRRRRRRSRSRRCCQAPSQAEATEQRRQPPACRVCLTCARPSCGGASGRLRAATSAATAAAASYTALNTCGQLGTPPPASLFFPWPSTSASDWAKCHGNFLIITGPIERDTRCEKCQRQRQRRRQRQRQRR